jgi:hypothetical protein
LLRKLNRRDSLYCQTTWFKLEKKMEGLQRWVLQDHTNESPHWEEVIVVKEFSDLSQAEESFLIRQKSCYGLHTEKVWLYLTSRQKLPTFWDLQEAEFLCFLSSQQVRAYLTRAGPIIAKLITFFMLANNWCVRERALSNL